MRTITPYTWHVVAPPSEPRNPIGPVLVHWPDGTAEFVRVEPVDDGETGDRYNSSTVNDPEIGTYLFEDIFEAVVRYVRGDWGTVDALQWLANDHAAEHRAGRIDARYTSDGLLGCIDLVLRGEYRNGHLRTQIGTEWDLIHEARNDGMQ